MRLSKLSHCRNFHGACDQRSPLQKFPLGVTKILNLRAHTQAATSLFDDPLATFSASSSSGHRRGAAGLCLRQRSTIGPSASCRMPMRWDHLIVFSTSLYGCPAKLLEKSRDNGSMPAEPLSVRVHCRTEQHCKARLSCFRHV